MLKDDIKIIDQFGSDPGYMIIPGCKDQDSLGPSPSGRITFSDIIMPRSVKPTGPF